MTHCRNHTTLAVRRPENPTRLAGIRAYLLPLFVVWVSLFAACSEPDKPTVTLYLAVQRGDLDQLERHIYWGTDINDALPSGKFPLQVAAENGRIILVKTLLKHGADIALRSPGGDTALDLAILAGRKEIAEILLAKGAELNASALLSKGASTGMTDREMVRFLIERGADTEHRSADGDTPLLVAIRQRNHRLANHLVNAGADVNATTADGKSALSLARELGASELTHLLERYGAR